MIAVTDEPVRRPSRDDGPDFEGAEAVETVVIPEHGRWAVEIAVVFPDGVVRHRIDTFPPRTAPRSVPT